MRRCNGRVGVAAIVLVFLAAHTPAGRAQESDAPAGADHPRAEAPKGPPKWDGPDVVEIRIAERTFQRWRTGLGLDADQNRRFEAAWQAYEDALIPIVEKTQRAVDRAGFDRVREQAETKVPVPREEMKSIWRDAFKALRLARPELDAARQTFLESIRAAVTAGAQAEELESMIRAWRRDDYFGQNQEPPPFRQDMSFQADLLRCATAAFQNEWADALSENNAEPSEAQPPLRERVTAALSEYEITLDTWLEQKTYERLDARQAVAQRHLDDQQAMLLVAWRKHIGLWDHAYKLTMDSAEQIAHMLREAGEREAASRWLIRVYTDLLPQSMPSEEAERTMLMLDWLGGAGIMPEEQVEALTAIRIDYYERREKLAKAMLNHLANIHRTESAMLGNFSRHLPDPVLDQHKDNLLQLAIATLAKAKSLVPPEHASAWDARVSQPIASPHRQ